MTIVTNCSRLLVRTARVAMVGWVLSLCMTAQVLDSTFNPSVNSDVRAIAVQTDGKILMGGAFTIVSGQGGRSYLARLNPSGTLDTTFGVTLNGPVYAVVPLGDGRILVGGGFTTVSGASRPGLARLNANGTLDATFNANVASGLVRAIVVQPDGKIVLGGSFGGVGGASRFCLARVGADGALDNGFVADATSASSGSTTTVLALARQPDGAIVVGGQFGFLKGQFRFNLGRLTANGDLDVGFTPQAIGGSVTAVSVQRDGRILVGGSLSSLGGPLRSNIGRLNPDGSPDNNFNPAASNVVFALVEQGDGKILVGGAFASIGGGARAGLARLQLDGTLDASFSFDTSGALSGLGNAVEAILLTSEGRILAGGAFTVLGGASRNGVARLVPAEPAITAQPASVTGLNGATVTFSVTAVGSALTYQWQKNGAAISGATSATLSFASVQAADAGSYDVVVSNSLGNVTSSAVTLTIGLPPTITTQPQAAVVVAGQAAQLTVQASGTPAPTYQWQKDGTNIAGATAATYAIAAAKAGDAGAYRCIVTNLGGSATSVAVALTVLPPARLANVSVRTTLASAQSVIVGFVVSGGTGEVLLRAAGPALAGFGVPTAMADPRLELYRDSTKLLENDDWPSVLTEAFGSVGAFPFPVNSRDAALRQTLSGAHSAVVSGTGPGVVLVEAYDLGTAVEGPRLVNLSARNRVGTDDDVLIAGFAVGGYGSLRVLIRAVGPTLGGVPFNLPGVLADPRLELRGAKGELLGANDDWGPELAPVFAAAGAFSLAPGGKDAALQATVASGLSYTVVVRGANGGTGIALVEIYELP